MRPRHALAVLLTGACAVAGGSATAQAATANGLRLSPSSGFHKGLGGPLYFGGIQPAFQRYHDDGADQYAVTLDWREIATRRPKDARNPGDGAYRWPSGLDAALGDAVDNEVGIIATATGTPSWASRDGGSADPPAKTKDFADFLAAASRKYRSIRSWRIWDATNQTSSWNGTPQRYAQLLDGAYAAIKASDGKDLVLGGSTTALGDRSAYGFIRGMRLSGTRKHPRMDVYAHDPTSPRPPSLGSRPLMPSHTADFNDTPSLVKWIDASFGRHAVKGHALRVLLTGYAIPTDRPTQALPFFVTRDVQAKWIGDALRAARSYKRIWGISYDQYSDFSFGAGNESTAGLTEENTFAPKPALAVFRAG